MSTTTLAIGLGIAGLIPFVAPTLVIYLLDDDLHGYAELAFVLYSSIILSFLSGSLWGRLLSKSLNFKVGSLLLLTNFVAVVTWLSLLGASWRLELSILMLSAGYLCVFAIEKTHTQLLYSDVVRGYLKLRGWLTTLVVGLHLAMLLTLY